MVCWLPPSEGLRMSDRTVRLQLRVLRAPQRVYRALSGAGCAGHGCRRTGSPVPKTTGGPRGR